ncbi:MAG: Gfo/Idh/MocA family oxidoreductase [Bacteroidetes bacterium]|nr:MAG: Gfo/Idh/MocA family oxidoreductase [Bacteroidota bacterium]
MKVLIVGLGSISRKHKEALMAIRPDAEFYALRRSRDGAEVEGVQSIYSIAEIPSDCDFALVATPTSVHAESLRQILPLGIPVFLEKPPLHNTEAAAELERLISEHQSMVYTAFNLRFHPLITWAKQYLEGKRVLEVQSYCGSYLPDWRPNQDYRTNYSALREQGGGVHLDLTHEIDFVRYLFGDPTSVQNNLRTISDLEIDSVDSARYWLEYPDKVINIVLNYFRRDPKRTLEVVMEDGTIEIDLIRGLVIANRTDIIHHVEVDIQETYNLQMAYWLNCLTSGSIPMNEFSESLKTLKICLDEW